MGGKGNFRLLSDFVLEGNTETVGVLTDARLERSHASSVSLTVMLL